MFGVGPPELLIVLAVALVFIGPKKLPEIARALGKGFSELRKAANDIKGQIDLESMMNEDDKDEKRKKEDIPKKDLDTLYNETKPDEEKPSGDTEESNTKKGPDDWKNSEKAET